VTELLIFVLVVSIVTLSAQIFRLRAMLFAVSRELDEVRRDAGRAEARFGRYVDHVDALTDKVQLHLGTLDSGPYR
jgi:hypothetical protein